MPRMYLTPAELNETPLGLGLATQINQLSSGVLDKIISRASVRCDAVCQKRLQAPGTSTLTANATAGMTTLTVASTLTLDDLNEQAVQINPGGANQETIEIVAGGVNVTSWASPYPGTITLASPLANSHSSGETVQYCYKEVTEAGSSSSSDPYTEALQTQAMQLALAHLPPATTALTRVVFLKAYPIISLYQIEHAFSFVNQFNQVDMNIESIVPSEGWVRFNVGTVILREGLMRTTYNGGYQIVPEDVKYAASMFVAEQIMQYVNPFGAIWLAMGKRHYRWNQLADRGDKTNLTMQAEDILKRYRRSV